MANSPQARKRARQNEKRRQHNMGQRSNMRTYIKNVLKAVAGNNLEAAKTAYQKAVIALDRLAGRKLVHANKAARLKSRLNSKIRQLSANN